MLAVLNLAQSGEHVVSASSIYGGTFNLFAVTLKRLGIEVTFVDQTASDEELEKAFRPNTRAVFGETLANPSMDVLDIERFAKLAHRHRLPLIVDNTFATPVLCRPFAFGADIVVHSTTKYMDGHALQMGGVIVDSGNFDWTSGKFPEFTEPDPSYHGLIYSEPSAGPLTSSKRAHNSCATWAAARHRRARSTSIRGWKPCPCAWKNIAATPRPPPTISRGTTRWSR